MAISFSKKYNKERLFNIDTSSFDYVSLETLYEQLPVDEETGEVIQEPFVVQGVYINTHSMFEAAPVVAIDNCYVNLPSHLKDVCSDMINDKQSVKAINEGKVGFVIYKYFQARFQKDCYSIEWVDL